MNRNTGIRGLFKPFRLPKEVAEDEAARAAVINKIGYSAPYNPVTLPMVTDTLTKLQAAPIEVKDKFGNTPTEKKKMIDDYFARRPSPSEYKGSWKNFVKQQAAKQANGYKGHIVKNTKFPLGNLKIIKDDIHPAEKFHEDQLNEIIKKGKSITVPLFNKGGSAEDKRQKRIANYTKQQWGIADKKDATNGAKYIPWYERNPQVQQKPKLKHQLEKEITELKKRNEVLVKHQKPLPDNVEEVQVDFQGQPRGQSSGKTYSVAEAAKMNEQWDRISPEDKNTLRYIEKINYETANTSDVKPPWMQDEKKLKGYYYNPVTNAMEPRNNPSPHISSNEKKLTKG
jgi:hypothetical protein|tara:strand:+ start:278 stop:1300 length:1023 start_codon:yes stop_codon:yes gene_type:complete